MTPEQLSKAIDDLGWTLGGTARFLRLRGANSWQTVRRWVKGEVPIPGSVEIIFEILETRKIPSTEGYGDKRAKQKLTPPRQIT